MLHGAKGVKGFTLAATDGALGKVKDLYFDDEKWTIRYLVADTGGWLSGRKVLISPFSVTAVDWQQQMIHANLTRQQIENSPSIDEAKPVSRQHETELTDYYGYPYYWDGPGLWGSTPVPDNADQQFFEDVRPAESEARELERDRADPHLRNAGEVIGCRIQTTDDSIGHVEDFLFEDKDWSIPLIVVDTRHWWPGKHVLISPKRIDHVDWSAQKVVVNVTRAQLEHSPECDSLNPPPLEIAEDLYRHVGKYLVWP